MRTTRTDCALPTASTSEPCATPEPCTTKPRAVFAHRSSPCVSGSNRFELPASTLSTMALCMMWGELWTAGGSVQLTRATRMLRTVAVLLLWLRVPRIFMLSDRIGPLVLMLFRMWKDVKRSWDSSPYPSVEESRPLPGSCPTCARVRLLQILSTRLHSSPLHLRLSSVGAYALQVFRYLILQGTFILAFSAAFLVLFEPRVPTDTWPLSFPAGDYRLGSCEDHMASYLPVVQFLIEAALTGEQFFLCGVNDEMRSFAWALAIIFYLTSGILMLNMLIAMMAKVRTAATEARGRQPLKS